MRLPDKHIWHSSLPSLDRQCLLNLIAIRPRIQFYDPDIACFISHLKLLEQPLCLATISCIVEVQERERDSPSLESHDDRKRGICVHAINVKCCYLPHHVLLKITTWCSAIRASMSAAWSVLSVAADDEFILPIVASWCLNAFLTSET